MSTGALLTKYGELRLLRASAHCTIAPLTGHAHIQRCLPSHATRIPTRPILTYSPSLTFFSSPLAALAAPVGIAVKPRLAYLYHHVRQGQSY